MEPTIIDNRRVLQYTLVTGIQGASAYRTWLLQPGNSGKSESEFFEFLRGPAMTWDDLSPEQKLYLKLKFEDLTEEEKLELKGDSLHWQDLTEEQKEEIRGEKGYTPEKGVDYFDGVDASGNIDGGYSGSTYSPDQHIDCN